MCDTPVANGTRYKVFRAKQSTLLPDKCHQISLGDRFKYHLLISDFGNRRQGPMNCQNQQSTQISEGQMFQSSTCPHHLHSWSYRNNHIRKISAPLNTPSTRGTGNNMFESSTNTQNDPIVYVQGDEGTTTTQPYQVTF